MSLAAADWERDAAGLEALADAARVALDAVVARHGPATWQGARADRFGRELADRRRALLHAAEQLEVEARLLRARAALVRGAP